MCVNISFGYGSPKFPGVKVMGKVWFLNPVSSMGEKLKYPFNHKNKMGNVVW
jgi:hypothetical protein